MGCRGGDRRANGFHNPKEVLLLAVAVADADAPWDPLEGAVGVLQFEEIVRQGVAFAATTAIGSIFRLLRTRHDLEAAEDGYTGAHNLSLICILY